jgi:peptidoglycan/xylan/chitin deacetylase (PgdA/CDA1 family)
MLPPFMRESLRTSTARTIERPEWPNGARCCVSLHVHVDGQTVWRGLGVEKLVYMTSGEYGVRTAVWRLLELFERHGVRASFFVPGWIAETYREIVEAASGLGHEIGHHSYSHTVADLGLMEDGTWNRAIEEREFDRALEILRRTSGQDIVGFVPAGGELTPHTIEILLSRGIRYQAQCSADDIPYWWLVDGKACGLLEVPTHWSLDDAPQFLYTLIPQMGTIKPAGHVFDMWRDDFDAFRHYGRCMVLQLHPQWIGRPARARMLERLLEHIRSFDDVWWATGAEIDAYWRSRYPPEASGAERPSEHDAEEERP